MLNGPGLRWIVLPKILNSTAGIYLPQALPIGKESNWATIEVITILGRRSESSMLTPEPIVVNKKAIAHIRTVFCIISKGYTVLERKKYWGHPYWELRRELQDMVSPLYLSSSFHWRRHLLCCANKMPHQNWDPAGIRKIQGQKTMCRFAKAILSSLLERMARRGGVRSTFGLSGSGISIEGSAAISSLSIVAEEVKSDFLRYGH